ncbi:MAG: GerMN domain-containing protein [Caldilineaceae bacterium]
MDIVDGVASIYLTGTLRVGGVCDEPRVRAQIEETALQYYTVDEVRIYVNGEPLAF